MNQLAVTTPLFEQRSEQVYFMAAEATERFVAGVSERLEPDSYCREDANGSAHYVTTLYFDSDSRAIARACVHGEGVRLRAREYYDRRGLDEIAREPFVWLEVKTREAGHTRKLRFPVPTHDMAAYLHDGTIDVQALQQPSWLGSTDDVLRAVAELCMYTREPLRPDCVAHYRRRAWQDENVRITVDTELSFYRPPNNPFAEGHSLSDALREPPVAAIAESLVEIKLRAPQPKWLRELIEGLGLQLATSERRSFSKFIAASRAVHP